MSYVEDKGKYLNSSRAGTSSHNQFERDWSQNLKKSSNAQLREFAQHREAEEKRLAKEEGQRLEAAIRAYRNRKG
jgi:hypothetical protein